MSVSFRRVYLNVAEFLVATERLPVVGPRLAKIRPYLGRWVQRNFHVDRRTLRQWQDYDAYINATPENADIPRVADAGQIINGHLVMHNGIHIGYDRLGEVLGVIQHNRGVLEPKQERIFGAIVAIQPPGATMVELGANWAFYSLWFHKCVPDGRNFLLEPDRGYLESGQYNFAINHAEGTFIHGAIGATPGSTPGGLRIWTLDELADAYHIDHIDLLHVDIDGAELDMLHGANGFLAARRIDRIVLSTHTQRSTALANLHIDCRALLVAANYKILADADTVTTSSGVRLADGLIVAQRSELPAMELPRV
jgi:hypothetical protein